jgi:hypothetical protein
VTDYALVDRVEDCTDGGFYVEGRVLRLCPDACDGLADKGYGRLFVELSCTAE